MLSFMRLVRLYRLFIFILLFQTAAVVQGQHTPKDEIATSMRAKWHAIGLSQFNHPRKDSVAINMLGEFDSIRGLPPYQSDTFFITHLASLAFEEIYALQEYQLILNQEAKLRPFISSKETSLKHAAMLLLYFGNAHYEFGNFDKCLVYTSEALKVLDKIDTVNVQKAHVYNLMGMTYGMMGHAEEVLEYYDKAIEIYNLTHFWQGSIFVFTNKAIVLANMGRKEEALAMCDSAMEYSLIGHKRKSRTALHITRTRGEIYAQLKDWPNAIRILNETMQPQFAEFIDVHGVIETNSLIGRAYYELGQMQQAEEYLIKALQLAKENRFKQPVVEITKDLINLYHDQKDYEKAFYMQSLHRLTKDSVLSENSMSQIAELTKKFELAEKNSALNQAQLEVQNQDLQLKTKQLYIILLSVVALALVGIVLGALYLLRRLKASHQQISQQNGQLQALNQQRDKLLQLLAHDLRGPIGSMQHFPAILIQMAEAQDQEALIDHLKILQDGTSSVYTLLETLLHWTISQKDELSFKPKPVSAASILMELEHLAQVSAANKQINLHFNYAEEVWLHVDDQALLTVLRNLLFNAIKFTPAHGHINLSVKQEGQQALITVSDTGQGMTAANLQRLLQKSRSSSAGTAGEKGTGLGISMIGEIARSQQWHLDAQSNEGQGTTFVLGVPLG